MTDAPTEPAGVPTPNLVDVLHATHEAREIAQQAAEEEPGRVAAIATEVGGKAGRLEGARVSRRFGLLALLVAFLVPLLLASLAYRNSVTTDREVDAALERLEQANVTLEARGQEPVQLPAADDPTQVVAAAVTAQILASLPPTPTAEEVADRLQGAVIGSLTGPSLNELARLVAGYFQDNPPQPGPPPTEAQIRAAVDASLAANPPAPGLPGRDGAACTPDIPACRGPIGLTGAAGADGATGATGPPGRSVVGQQFVRVDGECVSRVTFSSAPLVEDRPAGDAACPDPDDDGGVLPGLDG